jgi:L-alanine-DL-glutamate epimerase-like enolase superfamily enzyme
VLSAPIPPERRWTSDFGTNTNQDLAIVRVQTDDGLTGYGEAKGTLVVMKVLEAEFTQLRTSNRLLTKVFRSMVGGK